MTRFVLGAGCYSVVHVLGDIFGDDGTHNNINHIKHNIALFFLSGTRLAISSPALLIKPYQLLGEMLGEKYV
jgi:hypothetical protein